MNQDDAAVVKRVLAGDKSAFGSLIDRHRPAAVKFARRILGEATDAEDVVQEALLQAFLNLDSLRTPSRFGAWLSGIIVNLSKMRLRTQRDGYAEEDWYGGRVPPDFTAADLQPSVEAIYEVRELHNLMLAAIATLPTEQQQAVQLHYIDGLTLWEIGRLVGVPVGAVKVRLHRARARLRLELAQEFAETQRSIPRIGEKEIAMIAVTVHDIMVRAPKGEEVKWLGDVQDWRKLMAGGTWVVLLKEQAGERVVPLWVGIGEGSALAMLLADVSIARPLTFDLMARLLEVAEVTVEKMAVTSLRDNVYYATLWVKVDGRVHEVDARPSDALTLALRVKAPIFITPELLEQAGQLLLTPEQIPTGLEAIRLKAVEAQRIPPETTEMEYRSFRSLPRGDFGGWLKPAEK